MPIPGILTANEIFLINESRKLMPQRFSDNTIDEKILAFVQLVLDDINLWPPQTGFTIEGVAQASPLMGPLKFGVSYYSLLFQQMRATLEDFTWNDNGLTVAVDQVGKIEASYKNLHVVYLRMIENAKKNEIFKVGARGLSTPRFQSQLGQFLKISLGNAFVHGAF